MAQRNHREEIHNQMMDIMVDILEDIKKGLNFTADEKIDGVVRWIKVMRNMMPEQMEQSMQDIAKTLEAQKRR